MNTQLAQKKMYRGSQKDALMVSFWASWNLPIALWLAAWKCDSCVVTVFTKIRHRRPHIGYRRPNAPAYSRVRPSVRPATKPAAGRRLKMFRAPVITR